MNNWFWKFGMGTYGISVIRNISDGKIARKNLNANDDARVVTAPSLKLL